MANINQTVDSIGTGVRFQFAAAGDSYHVFSSVHVESTDTYAIFGDEGSQHVFVYGFVTAAVFSIFLTGGSNEVYIGRSAVIRSTISGATDTNVLVMGGNNTVTNHGAITSPSTVGLILNGGNNEVLNTGGIEGSSGVFLGVFGVPGDRFVNEGMISANDYDDANQDFRFNNGVYVEGDDSVIVNRAGGKISAISSEGAGVAIGVYATTGGDGSHVENQGTIQSRQWYGVDFANMVDAETASLENHGTIKGGSGAFRGNASGEVIINRGRMIGDVELGAGDDVFDGDKGSVKGAILGGSGNDYIFGGKGNESINGGLNDDIIVGGRGNDTLFGDSGIDTFVLRTGFGRDVVQDFIDGTDLIDLSRLKDVRNFNDLEDNHLEKHGNDMWIVAKGGDGLILKNVAPGDVDGADFIF
ncbi:hypothetical protein IHQ71_01265 [Rhizobium sp. TH2]|uniref:calcium-binding protein n=1 Tax=Rhizobium sp. TH2 TaxID=2775403 RepID=UPI002157FB7B|nr:hypothetical protein [Rhizobium sp. TH2]UVC09289.1 hypothetical protein IHQ71_01265 [Rhizobium sp. TH2]